MELRDGEQWLVYPAHLATRDDSVLTTWQRCAADDDLHPLVRTRLADLLWVRKAAVPPLWHKIAVGGYLAAAGDPQLEMIDREEGLRRAVRIATESNQDTGDVLTALADLAEEALAIGGLFGVVARFLQVLVDNKHPCAQILDDTAQQHNTDPHECDIVLLLKRQASQSAAEQGDLDQQRVQASSIPVPWWAEHPRSSAGVGVCGCRRRFPLPWLAPYGQRRTQISIILTE